MNAKLVSVLIASFSWACTGAPENTDSGKIVTTGIEEVQPSLSVETSNPKSSEPEAKNIPLTMARESLEVEKPSKITNQPGDFPLVSTKVKVEETDTLEEDKGTDLPDNHLHQHKLWDELLKKHVSTSGQVDYASIKKNTALLNKYLEQLNQNPIQASWTKSQQLAYWINAYNAFTVDLIVRNYPLQSIMDLDKPWDQKFIQLGNQHYSLNQIEHKIVRPEFKEPRIHFAFVCAAVSCPKLLNLAYTEDNLEKSLDAQTRYFLNESGKNNLTEDPLKISQLFNWYGEDFTVGQTVIDFLNKYSEETIASDVKIEFLDYNWELNE